MNNVPISGGIAAIIIGIFSAVLEVLLLKINDNIFLTVMGFTISGVLILYGIHRIVTARK